MSDDTSKPGVSRRRAMSCMMWGSAGVLWTVAGGVPRPFELTGEAQAATTKDFSFAQISDTHIGFKGAVNPEPGATLKEALARSPAEQSPPSWSIPATSAISPSPRSSTPPPS